MSRRTERVSDQLVREINDLLLREIRDPRARLATVSRAVVSADLHHARLFVSLLGSEDERAACLEALRGASGYLRSKLGARLRLRTTPELSFEIDRGPEHSMKIAEILEGLDHNEEP
jgi:ribosome-binding factor A